jgi:hypothetical protein
MVKLNVDYDSKAKCWFVKTSDLLGVHAEGETLEQLCGKLPAIVSDLVESNQTKMAGTCYCSFCGKSQHEVPKLIAGPAVFICDEWTVLRNHRRKRQSRSATRTREIKWKNSNSYVPMSRSCMRGWPGLKSGSTR